MWVESQGEATSRRSDRSKNRRSMSGARDWGEIDARKMSKNPNYRAEVDRIAGCQTHDWLQQRGRKRERAKGVLKGNWKNWKSVNSNVNTTLCSELGKMKKVVSNEIKLDYIGRDVTVVSSKH